MKKKIVVLGATGTVGSKISEILLNEGHQVTLVARHIEKLEKYRELGATLLAADITDVDTLTSAFKTADAAFVLMPDHVKAENVRAYQREVTGKLIEVIQNSGIKYIVNMSSLGAHMHEGTGIMAGTGEQEVRLNQLADVNVLHLRSAYFMENLLRTIGVVKNLGINGTAADGDHAIPMVATRDVAKVAAGYLSTLDFSGKVVQVVMGPGDYTLREFTGLIGKAIGKPDLAYVQFPADQAKQAFLKNGFSEDFADNLIEMGTSIKTGFMNYQKRDESTTTSTTAEEFINELYLPAYKAS